MQSRLSHDTVRVTCCGGSLLVAATAIALALLAGCGNNPITLTPADGGPTLPDPPPPATGPWTFVPDPVPAKVASARLELESVEGSRASLRLTASGVPRLQGLAFRLGFAPDRLKLTRSEQGPAWTAGSFFPTVVRFADKVGEVWGGLGFIGSHQLDASKTVVLARFELELTGADPIPIGFRAGRNLIIDPDNNPVEVSWAGGQFVRSR